jgi:3-dehydroquinate synthetase
MPEMKDNDVLVKIRTAGVNPLDNMIIKGEVKMIVPYSFPLIMGNELVGIVEKVGKSVRKFQSGDRVYGRMELKRIGAFAEYAAVDSVNVKDALRVVSHPAAVLVEPLFAKTILDGVWRGGIGEAVRLAVSYDGSFFRQIAKNAEAFKNRDFDIMAGLVREAATIRRKKGASTLADWCASRLESMSGYKLPHGYAVSIGICVDCEYSMRKGLLKEEERDAVRAVLAESGALDGLNHSRHLLSQADNVLLGLDAWRLSTGSSEIVVPSGIGKLKSEASPDRELMGEVLRSLCQNA